MSTKQLSIAVAVGWAVAVFSALAVRLAFVTPAVSVPEYAGWSFLGGSPAAIALVILRGRSSGSIAQVLYDTEHARDVVRTAPVTVPRG